MCLLAYVCYACMLCKSGDVLLLESKWNTGTFNVLAKNIGMSLCKNECLGGAT